MQENNLDEKMIIGKNQKFQKEADQILEQSKLLEILKEYGQVELTGSYPFGLMMNGDIDIQIFVKKLSKQKAKDLLNELIEKTNFVGYMFFDWVSYRNHSWPFGYYVGIKHKMFGYKHQWKIDIWLIEESTKSNIEYTKLLKNNLMPENKLLILKFKEWKNQNYPTFSSMPIYDAVLKEKINGLSDFVDFFNKNLEKYE